MNSTQFNDFIRIKQQEDRNILSSKAQEYSKDEDRFHNFKIVSHIMELLEIDEYNRREASAFILFLKHFASIVDIVNTEKLPSKALLNEKFGDARRYLLLIEAMYESLIEEEKEIF